MANMDSLSLLKALVNIPSDCQAKPKGGAVEFGVAKKIIEYLHRAIPDFCITEQSVAPGRMNVLVDDGTPTRLLFIGHMDTVQNGVGWTRAILGEQDGDRFYGRGSADMKAGIVAIIAALAHARETEKKGMAALFYCDEEYNFLGMKKFIDDYGATMKPKLVVCPEPTGGMIRRGSRGICEFRVVVRGSRGHAARAGNGASAILGFWKGIDALGAYLETAEDEYLGRASLNIAGLRAGALERGDAGEVALSTMGNVIPDYCEAVVEIRTIPGISYDTIITVLTSALTDAGCSLQSAKRDLNLGTYATDRAALAVVESAQQAVYGVVIYQPAADGGYSDIQMLAEHWRIPAVIWGPAGGNTHGIDEYVELSSIEKLEQGFRLLIDRW